MANNQLHITTIVISNQELLDCVYDAHTYNACHGGTEHRAFQFVIKRKRLALWKDYPYEAVDKR